MPLKWVEQQKQIYFEMSVAVAGLTSLAKS